MSRDETVKDMAKILCPKGTANCEKCSKSYKCDVKFSQLAKLVEAGCRKAADDEIVESMKTYERARQETAREILQEFEERDPYSYDYDIDVLINDIAQKYGIEW